MAKSKTALNNELREKYCKIISELVTASGEEVLRIKSNEFCFPCVDSEGNDKFIQFTIKVPTIKEGEDFDGYELAEDFKFKCEQDKIKKEKAELAKQKKIEKDTARRAEAERLRAERKEKEGR